MPSIKDLVFYHGTNTVFNALIKEYGLGGYDIVKESKGIELLSKLNRIAEEKAEEKYMDHGWGMLRMSVLGILLQTPGESINWQHGDVYVTPSLNRALRYAVRNAFGSELFTHIYHVYNFLSQIGFNEANDVINDYPIVKELISKKGDPIVIEINNLTDEDLLTEGGSDPKRNLNKLRELSKQLNTVENNYLDEFGFRLKKIISLDQLIIHSIEKKS